MTLIFDHLDYVLFAIGGYLLGISICIIAFGLSTNKRRMIDLTMKNHRDKIRRKQPIPWYKEVKNAGK